MRRSVHDTITKKCATIPQAAEITGYSQPYIRNLVQWGKIPALKIGKDYLIDRMDLQDMKKGNRI